jgi:hypothetical protein
MCARKKLPLVHRTYNQLTVLIASIGRSTGVALFAVSAVDDAIAAEVRILTGAGTEPNAIGSAVGAALVAFLVGRIHVAVAAEWTPLALRCATVVERVVVRCGTAGGQRSASFATIALLAGRDYAVPAGGRAVGAACAKARERKPVI